jgi:Na+/H+ antiporter NhaC
MIPDKYIPVILLPIGIVGAFAFAGINAKAVVQGILVTGAAVYTNQLIKQMKKSE